MKRSILAVLTPVLLGGLVASPAAADPGVQAVFLATGDMGTQGKGIDEGHVGIAVGAELRMWRLLVGAALGRTVYEDGYDNTPLSATVVAAYAGGSFPAARWGSAPLVRELEIRAALEIGRHTFSPDGETSSSFLGGIDSTVRGPETKVGFVGARTGLSVSFLRAGGLDFFGAVDLVGRRDLREVELHYRRAECGSDPCRVTEGTIDAGGTEISALVSAGILFGR